MHAASWAMYGTSFYILTTGTGSQSWWRLPTWSRNVDKQYVIFGCIRVINIAFVSTWWNFSQECITIFAVQRSNATSYICASKVTNSFLVTSLHCVQPSDGDFCAWWLAINLHCLISMAVHVHFSFLCQGAMLTALMALCKSMKLLYTERSQWDGQFSRSILLYVGALINANGLGHH